PAAGSWRGISDPPSLVRVVLSLLGGAAVALATRGSPRRWRTPLVGFALAGAPLVPVYTGHALALLALQGPILTLVVGVSIAVALARAMLRGEPGLVSGAILFAAPFVVYACLAAR